MKRLIFVIAFVLAAMSAGAQNCDAIVLPMFGNDAQRMAEYPADKLLWFCLESQASFYESDTLPAGAVVYSITEVKELYGAKNNLPANYVVNLETLSFYAYNFEQFYFLYPEGNTTICFSTPSSAHNYLVLRSVNDRDGITRRLFREAVGY